MFQLTYYSKASLDLTSEDISNILKKSREYNSKNDITGCLLFHNDIFLQLLEGEEGAVKEIFAIIEKDTRHLIFNFLSEGNIETRTFKNWSMAYHEFNNAQVDQLHNLIFVDDFLSFADLVENPTHANRIFFDLAKHLLEA